MEAYRKTLLISAQEVKANSLINYNVEDSYLTFTINTVQEVYLEQITGTALFHKLQLLVYNQAKGLENGIYLETNAEYRKLLEEFVKPYMIARCQADILYNISYKIRNIGVSKNSDDNVSPADITEIRALEDQYKTYVDAYASKLSKYLYSTDFPELEAAVPEYFEEPEMNSDYGNVGLWLGGSKDSTRCNSCKNN